MAGRSLPHLALPAHGVTRKCRGSPPPRCTLPDSPNSNSPFEEKAFEACRFVRKNVNESCTVQRRKIARDMRGTKQTCSVRPRSNRYTESAFAQGKGFRAGSLFLYASPFQLSRTCTNDGAEAHASALPAQLFKHNQAVRTFLRPRHRRRLRHRRRSLRQSRHQNSRSRQRWSRSRHRSLR